jgi:hypothetical protein
VRSNTRHHRSSWLRLTADAQGLSSLEYALLFVVICVGSLALWKSLGRHFACQMEQAQASFSQALGGTPEPVSALCSAASGTGTGNSNSPPQATQARKLAEALVQTAGTATAADREAVLREVAKLPVGGLQALRDQGIRITVVRNSVVEALPNLKGVRPRGWPPGTGWDTVPGTYDPNTHQVVIATRNGSVPATGNGHGSSDLVVHETGHAIDAAVSGHNSAAFQAARNQDLASLPPYQTQPGEAGLQETYAESMALYRSNPQACKQRYPHLYNYWATDPLNKH